MIDSLTPITGEIGGVPAWWVADADGTGLLAASLFFRVGLADQTLATTGWAQVMLDVAIRGADCPPGVSLHLSVQTDVSVIDVSGPPDLVASTLSEVTRRLSHPDRDELMRRCAELADDDPPSDALAESMAWRFGLAGAGSQQCNFLGLRTATPERLLEFGRGAFSRSNAALAFDGPPPLLHLALEDSGPRRPVPDQTEVVPTPGLYHHSRPTVVFTGLVHRSAAAVVTTLIAGNRLTRELRHKQGTSYSPQPGYDRIGLMAQLFLTTDARPGSEQGAAQQMVSIVRSLAAYGATEQELDEYRLAYAADLQDPFLRRIDTRRIAHDVLTWPSGRADTHAEILAEIDRITVSSTMHVASAWSRTGLLGLPFGVEAPNGLPALDGPLTDPPLLDEPNPFLLGTVATHRGLDGDARSPSGTLLCADHTVQLIRAPDRLTVRLMGRPERAESLAAMAAWPDGQRILYRRDGCRLVIDPTKWADSEALIDRIDAAVPESMVARMTPDETIAPPSPLPSAQKSSLYDWGFWGRALAVAFVIMAFRIMDYYQRFDGSTGLLVGLIVGLVAVGALCGMYIGGRPPAAKKPPDS